MDALGTSPLAYGHEGESGQVTHAELDGLYELYALGVLEPELRLRSCAHRPVFTVTSADRPGRSFETRGEFSRAIFTGTRWTIFVKLPVALSGGSSANCDPLAGES